MNTKMLIDGKLADGAGQLDVVTPATGKVMATVARADEAQIDAAVAAARAAQPAWAALSWDERGAVLTRFGDAVEANREAIAALLTAEQGKPLNQAMGETAVGIHHVRHIAAQRVGVTVVKETNKTRILEHRTPLGVVAAIVPWNFPVMIALQKIAPALMAGNAVVLKPAPTTPLCALMLAELAADIFPAGVLNVVIDNNDLGSHLTSHPDVAKVSFTGSTGTGRKVMGAGAGTLKRITLELGGNDAAIILDDVNPREIAPKIFFGAMINAGQVCLAIKRVYAPAKIYDELCDELARLAREAAVGDGAEPGTLIGPVQNRQQFEKLHGFLEDAHASGTVLAGGKAVEGGGYFIEPTIVRDIPDSARLVREEQFGPILPVLSYEDIDDAIARANDSEFGLGGTIWTNDIDRGIEVAMKIDTGTVWVNKHLDLPLDVPFGGSKQSGIGREQGEEGLLAFTQAHVVNVALA